VPGSAARAVRLSSRPREARAGIHISLSAGLWVMGPGSRSPGRDDVQGANS